MPLSLSRPILEQGFLAELKQTKKEHWKIQPFQWNGVKTYSSPWRETLCWSQPSDWNEALLPTTFQHPGQQHNSLELSSRGRKTRTKDRGGGEGGQQAKGHTKGRSEGREEFGCWEAIHTEYKEPMSTWVGLEGQKTELALEWPAEFIHVARLGTRGGQAKKCRGGWHKQQSFSNSSLLSWKIRPLNAVQHIFFYCSSKWYPHPENNSIQCKVHKVAK